MSQNSPAADPKTYRPDIRRVSIRGERDGVEVPFDELNLSNGEKILVNAVSGPQNIQGALPKIGKRFGTSEPSGEVRRCKKTQLEYAREGTITPQMEYVAIRESGKNGPDMAFTPQTVMQELASGHAALPCNANHPECEPMIIGSRFSCKVNANIGASSVSSGFSEELKKLRLALRHGADTVMDLSTGIEDLTGLRNAMLRASPVPLGTVPAYEALDRAEGKIDNLTWELFRDTVISQARQGVDYFTIHAGLTADLLPYAASRSLGIVSRGGSVMAAAMMRRGEENLAWEHFDELLEICHDYDVALSLGDGLRPGCIADACDKAQYGELANIGKLIERCRKAGVQAFVEGPGHVPFNRVEENERLEEILCDRAPFYTLGPLVTDIAPGYDHITSAIGGTAIAAYGAAMLCYVTPSEHLALPEEDDVKEGLITYRLAAHAADLAKGLPGARARDDAMARARAEFRWFDQFTLSLDPMHACEVWRSRMPENCSHTAAFCSMCGPRFCPIRLNRELTQKYSH
ncbi:MAG: phosphomethylpyrimidine synthase ThiC [Succinivibrio sp.]|jgi:phosphomethylpyrimidine synthase|nr:phosphomethylpyrimidine synthase ThiC [Succinivibrio sp.]